MESRKKMILAIDDNQDNLITIKALIKEAFPESQVLTSLSGAKGIDIAMKENPDVILLDIVMPDMDGFEVCKRLKADKNLSDIPVVFVTALKGDKDSRIKGLEVGAEAFLAKPIDETELVAQIRAMLKIKQANLDKRNDNEHLTILVAERTLELKQTHTATLNLLEDLKSENKARKETAEALRDSEARLTRAELAAKSGNWELHTDTGKMSASIGASKLYGVEFEELDYDDIKGIPLPQYRSMLDAALKNLIEKNKPYNLEYKIKQVNTGNIVDVHSIAFFDKEKRIVFGVIQNISERIIAQNALSESESKYRLITEKISDVVWLMDLNGKSTFVSQSIEKFTGYSVEEYLSQSLNQRLTPESAKKAIETLQNEAHSLKYSIAQTKEYKKILILDYICKDGTIKTGEVLVSPYLDQNDVLIGIHGVTRDITERKQVEEKLQQSESKYRFMTENTSDVIWHMDENFCFDYVSHAVKKLQGFEPEELIGKCLWSLLKPEGIELVNNKMAESKTKDFKKITEMQFEFEGLRKDGTWVWTEVNVSIHRNKDNNILGYHGVTRDITARKVVEERLHYVTRLYALLSHINQAIFKIKNAGELFETICQLAIEHGQFRMGWIGVYDKTNDVIIPMHYAGHNDGYLDNILIYPGDDFTAKGPTGLAFSQERMIFCNDIATDPMMSPWKKEALDRGYRSSFATPLFRKGKPFGALTLYASEINFFDEDEQKLLSEISEDISYALDALDADNERKLAEVALVNSRLELKTIYDHAPVMMCVVDEERRILFANNAFSSLTGLSEALMKGGAVGGVIGCINSLDHPGGCGHGPKCKTCNLRFAMESTFKTGAGHQNVEYQSKLIIDGDKMDVSLLGSTALIKTSEHNRLLLCLHNITDRKLAEDALYKSEMLLRTFIDNAPFEIWARDNEGVGVLENKKLVEHYGSIIGQTPALDKGIADNTVASWININERVLAEEVIDEEYELMVQGEPKIYQQIVFPIQNNSKMIGIAGFNIDVTERKHVEEALHNSEALYHSFVEHMPAGVFRKNREGQFVFVNSVFCNLKGFAANDIIGKTRNELSKYEPIEKLNLNNEIVHIENTFLMSDETDHELIMETGESIENEEVYTNEDGAKLYLNVIKSPVFSSTGEVIGTQGIQFDITQRKKMEEDLTESQEQLKKFAAHLQNIREEERVLLAREIHDELGQILVAVKIDMGILKKNVLKVIDQNHSDDVLTKFKDLTGLVDNTISTARKIMTDLRPEVLDLLGFSEAVRQHLKNFEMRYKVSSKFDNQTDELNLSLQQSVALFRIIQEALNNVAKHAKASEVKVSINQVNNKLQLEISDNGVGFDDDHKKNIDSYGLIGMKERVFLLDGELFVNSQKGKGTIIRVEMPYK